VVSVVVALIAGVTGLLAGLLPSLLVSPRRRQLHLMKEENELVDSVADERARDNLLLALRRTSHQYAALVRLIPLQKSKARLLRYAPYLLALFINGSLLVFAGVGETAKEEKAMQYVG
jgi:hypothetical protein